MNLKAFSLIELMVVIAIIAVLSAVAIPSYKDYKVRATLSQAVVILNNLADKQISEYTLGKSMSSFNYGSGSITDSMAGFVVPPVVRIGYFQPAAVGLSSPVIFVMCTYVTGLEGSHASYVAPTVSTDGQKAALCLKVSETNGVFNRVCGSFTNGTFDINPAYAPSGCNCANVATGAC